VVKVDPEAIDIKPFRVRSTWNGSRLVCSLAGELDLLSGEAVVRSLSEALSALDGGRPDIELDLSELAFIDLAGYHALLLIHDDVVGQRHGLMRLSNANGQASQLFALLEESGHALPFATE
jgi:anti-anti-sigma factor